VNKVIGINGAFLLLGATLLLASCFGMYTGEEEGETGVITISLSGGARAAEWPPSNDTISKLEHRIFLEGPAGGKAKAISCCRA